MNWTDTDGNQTPYATPRTKVRPVRALPVHLGPVPNRQQRQSLLQGMLSRTPRSSTVRRGQSPARIAYNDAIYVVTATGEAWTRSGRALTRDDERVIRMLMANALIAERRER